MTDDHEIFSSRFSRRSFLTAAATAGAGLAAGSLVGAGSAQAAEQPQFPQQPGDPVGTPRVSGLHLQFGADAASEVVVSWHCLQPVTHPRVLLGHPDGAYERSAPATTVSYTDAKSGQIVYAHHAPLRGLRPDRAYTYAAIHDGAQPEFGSFRTAPRGRSRFTFTSFGTRAPQPPARCSPHHRASP